MSFQKFFLCLILLLQVPYQLFASSVVPECLGECDCPSVTSQNREVFRVKLSDQIARDYEREKPLVLVSYGSGLLLLEWKLTKSLEENGFTDIRWILMDFYYSQDMFTHHGNGGDDGFVEMSNALLSFMRSFQQQKVSIDVILNPIDVLKKIERISDAQVITMMVDPNGPPSVQKLDKNTLQAMKNLTPLSKDINTEKYTANQMQELAVRKFAYNRLHANYFTLIGQLNNLLKAIAPPRHFLVTSETMFRLSSEFDENDFSSIFKFFQIEELSPIIDLENINYSAYATKLIESKSNMDLSFALAIYFRELDIRVKEKLVERFPKGAKSLFRQVIVSKDSLN